LIKDSVVFAVYGCDQLSILGWVEIDRMGHIFSQECLLAL
jgi:hypothetical protein